MFKNFGKDIKADEFLRVTIAATVLVLGLRLLFYRTNARGWFQEAITQSQQRTALPRTSKSIPADTPAPILAANQSVVMLTGDQSIGSGVILTSNGLILTNSHVVRNGGGNRWKVQLANKQELPAHVVAVGNREAGIFYDLALLQIEGASNLPVAQFDDGTPKAGELVWAIGSPYGRPDVITQGELKQITQDGILLTNTEVHPGNSGGPLLNQNGEVIGINTEINPSLPNDADTASISVSVLEEYLPKLMQ